MIISLIFPPISFQSICSIKCCSSISRIERKETRLYIWPPITSLYFFFSCGKTCSILTTRAPVNALISLLLMGCWCCLTPDPWGFFLGLHLWHMEVPRLGIELELQLLAYTTVTATWDPSLICDPHHSLRQCWILNPLSEAMIKPMSSWILVSFFSAEPYRDLLLLLVCNRLYSPLL